MLVGQTIFENLEAGPHEKVLTGSDIIHFEAGDVIGLQFDNYNPLPYDLQHSSCLSDERVLFVVDQDKPILHEGAVYAFQEKPDSWKACRMYSLFARYNGEGELCGYMPFLDTL